jgi:hypothetical protein
MSNPFYVIGFRAAPRYDDAGDLINVGDMMACSSDGEQPFKFDTMTEARADIAEFKQDMLDAGMEDDSDWRPVRTTSVAHSTVIHECGLD